MSEAVDRLLRVPDREQVSGSDALDQIELHTVGVLELVDHHVRKAPAIAIAQLTAGREQLAAEQLEILEIER